MELGMLAMNAPVAAATASLGAPVAGRSNTGVTVLPAGSSGAISTSGVQLGDLFISGLPSDVNAPVASAAAGTALIGGGGGSDVMTVSALTPASTAVVGGGGSSDIMTVSAATPASITDVGSSGIYDVGSMMPAGTVNMDGGIASSSLGETGSGLGSAAVSGTVPGAVVTSIVSTDTLSPDVTISDGTDPTGATTGGGATAAPTPALTMTSVGSGGSVADAALVEKTLTLLGTSAAGADEVDRLRRVGANINVLSGAEFQANGESDAHAYFDPAKNVLYLRRDDLQADPKLAAVEIAHEGTHLLDHAGKVSDTFTATRAAANAGLPAAQAAEAAKQLNFENMMVAESRAFVYAGQVARDLGWAGPATDPTSVASAGGNDAATYAKVWQSLLAGAYNEEHRTAAPVMV